MIDFRKELGNCKTIAISGHVRPDGDCIGSVLGTYLYLCKLFPDAKVVPMIEEPAKEFSFLKGIEEICTDFNPGIDEFDAFVGLDCSTTDRYGDAIRYFEKAKKTVVIDHHVSNDGFGDASYIDGKASSTCELVYDCLEKELVDIDIAQALYVGIIHDTGVMQYSNTSPKTLRIVADLVEFGFNFPDIIESTFYERTKTQSEMLGRALTESIMFMDGKCIVAKVDKKTMDFYGAVPHDLDGIGNQMRYIEGVEVSIFMYEIEPMKYKVSLRSKGAVDVASIAKFYNGGGHSRAAGFTFEGTFYDCVNNVSDSIAMQLEK